MNVSCFTAPSSPQATSFKSHPSLTPAPQSKEAEKASRYLASLYDARCNAQWPAIPELARKLEKHNPEKRCLCLAARAGALFETRPGAQACEVIDRDYGESMISAASEPATPRADALDAFVTRAALLFYKAPPEAVLELLPEPLHDTTTTPSGSGQGGWLAATVMRGTLLRGLALERAGRSADAAQTYRPIIGYVARIAALPTLGIEVRKCAEELLSHTCLFFSSGDNAGRSSLGEAMAAFHVLSRLLGDSNRFSTRFGTFTSNSPRQVWRAYYSALSEILRNDLVYHPSPLNRDHESLEHRGLLDDAEFYAARRQQRTELRRVEISYEKLLLEEVKFPKATETNMEVLEWVDLVMSNWQVLCGPRWTEEEVGQGGKRLVARNVLDILYRAATKTFHSSRILRHLFTIHTYLGEFNLSLKAFDTYVDIMTKGKARAAKSGKSGPELDDDETSLKTAAEAVRVVCRYGGPEKAEKALQIGATIQDWLKQSIDTVSNGDAHEKIGDVPNEIKAGSLLTPEVLALSHRAIGISQAHWARYTTDAEVRIVNQKNAIGNFEKALSQKLPDSQSTETLYALALCQAETRDIMQAVELVKRALQDPAENEKLSSPAGVVGGNPGDVLENDARRLARQRKALPLWHLLGQLLSACEEFDTAAAACDAAFEQIAEHVAIEPSSDLQEKEPQDKRFPPSVLELFEKQTLIELRMTQIALIEIVQGPEAAVNASNELFALYAHLFGVQAKKIERDDLSKASPAPTKSMKGTVRGMFSRPATARTSVVPESARSIVTSIEPTPRVSRPPTIIEDPPTIQVTKANGQNPSSPINEEIDQNADVQEASPKKSSSIRRKAGGSLRRKRSNTSERPRTGHQNKTVTSDRVLDEKEALNGVDLPEIPHNVDHRKEPPPLGHTHQPPVQDTRLPVPPPDILDSPLVPQFLELQKSRQQTTLLVQVWLFIADLYQRAALYNDAKGAIDEAHNLVVDLELQVSAKEQPSLVALQAEGWGGGKSVEELYADVFSSRGDLLRAQSLFHDAMRYYDQALEHFSDHARAIPGVATVLLDIYSKVVPPEKPEEDQLSRRVILDEAAMSVISDEDTTAGTADSDSSREKIPEPPELYRIAGRDRAYGLLSSLTKLGAGWDSPEAWMVLARAYEESGQIDKAKEALWWTVDLDETQPVRHWRSTSPGGFVL